MKLVMFAMDEAWLIAIFAMAAKNGFALHAMGKVLYGIRASWLFSP